MTADAAPALPQTCYPTVWLWPGQALYAGPSLNLAPHSGSVWCLAVGIGGPLTVATQDGVTRDGHSVLIPPRLTHHLTCHGNALVSCYLEPTSDRADAGRHKFGAWRGDIGVGHVDEERLQFMPTDDETADYWLDLAAPSARRRIDPRITQAANRIRDDPATTVSSAELAAEARLSESRFLPPVSRRAWYQHAPLPRVGAAGARGHRDCCGRQPDRGGHEGRLRQPIAPGRPFQVDLRAQRVTASGDGADPADA